MLVTRYAGLLRTRRDSDEQIMETLSTIPKRNEVKTCHCGEEFIANRSFQIHCSPRCNNKAQLVKRQDYLDKVKLEQGCARCGYNSHAEALQFNHINPEEKSFNIGENKKLSIEKINEEISKCEVLCANCHAIHTKQNHYSRVGATRTQGS